MCRYEYEYPEEDEVLVRQAGGSVGTMALYEHEKKEHGLIAVRGAHRTGTSADPLHTPSECRKCSRQSRALPICSAHL